MNAINWLLFVMYQFLPFSSVPTMKKLRTDEYKYIHIPLTILNQFLAFERLESCIAQLL